MTNEILLRPLPKKEVGDDSIWVAHFGGLFNPVHLGHIKVGKILLDKYSFDKVVYVPGSSRYPKPDLAPEKDRVDLLRMSTRDDPRFEVSDFELGKDQWVEPIETLMFLKEKFEKEFRNVRLFTIRGDDWLPEMMNWTSELIEHKGLYEFIIVPRISPSIENVESLSRQIDVVSRMSYAMEIDKPIDVSSSLVRDLIQRAEFTTVPLPAEVLREIRLRGLYGIKKNQ